MPPKSAATEPAIFVKQPAPAPALPITADELATIMTLADILFKGGLVPACVKRPEGLAAIIIVGRGVGLNPTQSIANIMIVNGKSTIWGDAVPGLVIASGLLEERKEWYEGAEGDDDFTAVCSLKRVGEKEARVTRFSVEDAKRAHLWGKKGPWQEYPARQMMWRARSWCYRDTFPDVMCGLVFAEEVMDYPESSGRVTSVEKVAVAVTATADEKPVPAAIETRAREVAAVVAPVAATDELELGPDDAQFERLMELRNMICVSKSANTEEEAKAIWTEVLAPFGVTSVMQMTGAKIDELIEQLGKAQDPFTHPPLSTLAT